mmetsp:Transcript_48936/g.57159  ORF Transcript_48936/g.57159 Transcript_48936/m.57159 type:complete len:101 (+) Transcript_48936:483-785(+)
MALRPLLLWRWIIVLDICVLADGFSKMVELMERNLSAVSVLLHDHQDLAPTKVDIVPFSQQYRHDEDCQRPAARYPRFRDFEAFQLTDDVKYGNWFATQD